MTPTSANLRFYLLPLLFILAGGCKSTKPAFSNVSPPPAASGTAARQIPAPASPEVQPGKTLAKSPQKVQPDTSRVKPQKTLDRAQTYTPFSDDEEDAEPVKILSPGTYKNEKWRMREKERGRWLSGSFLGTGTALLLAALVLAIIGSGPAGWLAVIGGIILLAGVIFSMVALLGR